MSRRGHQDFPGVDPYDPSGGPGTYYFNVSDLKKTYKRAPQKLYNLETVREVLKNPHRIWRGIREDRAQWLCFCGQPAHWYIGFEESAPFPRDCLYCVFVNDLNVVYEWRAEKAAIIEPGRLLDLPGCEFRFQELIWPSKAASRR